MAENLLPEQIASRLRRAILRGTLAPGDTIKERDTSAELGVSRTPLREAIRILALEGLVQLRPARSPIVARPGVKEITDGVEVLLAVEKLSGELACVRATQEDLDGIEAILAQMTEGFATMDPLDLFEIDMAFHAAIARAAHNAPLAEIHRTFLSRLWRARFLSAVKRRNRMSVIDHHTAILTALRARDADALRRALDAHLDRLTDDIAEVIRQEQQEAEQGEAAAASDTAS